VGIGTTSPADLLTLQRNDGRLRFNNTAGTRVLYLGDDFGSGGFQHIYDASGNIKVQLSAGVSYFNGGNVGIGTTSPGDKLVVVGGRTTLTANSEIYQLKLSYNSSTNGFWLGSPSADELAFYNNAGTERLRITSGGNVAIGSTTAFSRLTVNGALSQDTSQISLINSEGGHYIIRTGIAGIANQGLVFLSANQDGTGQTSRLVINSSGNVGIGTTTPSEKLEVNGNIKTAAPTGYTAKPWKLGEVFTGTITPDRHIMVEIDGNIYTIPVLLGTP
jgi:hypothetical protein